MKVFQRWRWPSVLLAMAFFVIAGDASAQVQVAIRTLYPVETVYIADLTPNTSSSNPGLFEITLVNGAAGSQTIKLRFTIKRVEPTLSQLFVGTTDPFTLSGPTRRLTTRDLFGSGEFSIQDYTIAPDDELRDELLQSGKLPTGSYVFGVDVLTAQDVLLDHDEVRIDIGTAARVELLTPGRLIGETPPSVPSTGLRFMWSTDAHTGAQYRVRVVRVEGATSGEEAMQGNASWETITPATSEFYPASSAALRLEPGATYAWQVTREVVSSSGVERVKSPVYWFRIGEPGNQFTGAGVDESVRLRIVEMLGKMGLGSELNGFRPVSARLSDGRILSFETLEELIAAIASGQIALVSLRVR
jgi:hypothetical protein